MTPDGYEEDGGATIDDLAGLYRCVRELLDERDRLRARMLELESQVGEREQHLRDALKDTRAERDRLRVVVDAAREFAATDTAWHAKIERGENVRSTDDESRRRAGAILALVDAVRQLDGSADMGEGSD